MVNPRSASIILNLFGELRLGIFPESMLPRYSIDSDAFPTYHSFSAQMLA